MKRQHGLVVVVALLVLLAVTGCGGTQGPREAIIGTWGQVDGGDTYTFTSDGAVSINGEMGKYEFLDDTRLHIDIQSLHYSSYTWGVKVSNDLLQLISQSGQIVEFKRASDGSSSVQRGSIAVSGQWKLSSYTLPNGTNQLIPSWEDAFITFTDNGKIQAHYEYRVTTGNVIRDASGTYSFDGTKLSINLEQEKDLSIQLGTIVPKLEGDWEVVPAENSNTLTIKNNQVTLVFIPK